VEGGGGGGEEELFFKVVEGLLLGNLGGIHAGSGGNGRLHCGAVICGYEVRRAECCESRWSEDGLLLLWLVRLEF
jgi:hypothetical protein